MIPGRALALAAVTTLMASLAPGHRAAGRDEVSLAVALVAGPVADDLAAVRSINALARAVSALSGSQERLCSAGSQIEAAIEAAREHLHDDDLLEGVAPPLSGLTAVEISEALLMWQSSPPLP
jgi:hypothetical protein